MPRTPRCLAILDTQWGAEGRALPWFQINTANHSGRRLYRLTGLRFGELLVTNACPEQRHHSSLHGTPDAAWLRRNLEQMAMCGGATLPLLVCGAVAHDTYKACGYRHAGRVFYLLHPAARTWTRALLVRTARRVQRATLV